MAIKMDSFISSVASVASVEPITFSEFIKNDILILGRGNKVETFIIQKNELQFVCRIIIDSNFRPHGIRCFDSVNANSQYAAVFGGRCLALINISLNGELYFDSSNFVRCRDWILDACFDADRKLSILLAHNQVLDIALENMQLSSQVTEFCHSRNGLLSTGKLYRNADSSLTVICCSFLGLLYKYNSAAPDEITTYSGHEGCIFSLAFNEMTGDIVAGAEDRGLYHYVGGQTQPQHALFGHSERIWQVVKVRGSVFASSSLGEIILWDFSLDPPSSTRIASPANFNLWALSCGSVAGMDTVLVAGGDDGGIYFTPVLSSAPQTSEIAGVGHFAIVDSSRFLYIDKSSKQVRLATTAPLHSAEALPIEPQIVQKAVFVAACHPLAVFALFDGSIYVSGLFNGSFLHIQRREKCMFCKLVTFCSNTTLLVTCNLSGRLYLARISNSTTRVVAEATIETELDNFARSVYFEQEHNLLIVGMRHNGTVYVVNCADFGEICVTKLKGFFADSNAVTDTVRCPTYPLADGTAYFYSSTKSSCLYTWRFDVARNAAVIEAVAHINVNWISKLLAVDDGVVVAGFKSKRLFLLDARTSSVLYAKRFIGSEQNWDIFLGCSSLQNGVLLSHSNGARLEVDCLRDSWPDALIRSPIEGLHSAKVTSSALLSACQIATVSEDGTIKKSTVDSSGFISVTDCVWTGLEQFCCVHDASSGLLIAGAAKGSICCFSLDPKLVEKCRISHALGAVESRVKAVSCIFFADEVFILAGHSTGELQLHRLSTASWSARVVDTLKLPSACTQIQLLSAERGFIVSTTQGRIYIVSVFDGKLASSRVSFSHKGAVLAMAVYGGNMVATGGDDNSIALFKYVNAELQLVACNVSAHSSAVTGLQFLSPLLLVSVALDLRVCVFAVPDLKYVTSILTLIYDAQSLVLSVTDKIRALISGIGVELIEFKLSISPS